MPAVGPDTTSFVVRGLRNGSVVSVAWRDGRLTGDPPTVDLIVVETALVAANRLDSHFAGAVGFDIETDGPLLADPVAAFSLVERVVDRITEVVAESLNGT